MDTHPNYQSLIDMGFSDILAKAAMRQVGADNIDALINWIDQHSEETEKWAKWLEENKEVPIGQVKVENTGQSITHLINKQMSEALQAKGHSKNVAEKSLLFTSNASVESAQAWIQEHKYDPDFEEPLLLQGQAFQQSTLTDQQAKQKLKQLTEKARQNRKKRQEQEAIQREKNRVRYGKQMIEAKRIAEEQALKRQLELDKIQKRKDEQYKQQLLEQMRMQRQAKLGIKSEGGNKTVTVQKKQQPKLSKIEQLQVQCEQVKVGMHAYPEKAKVFFQTARIYVENMLKNNGQQKFRKINKQNKAFQSRIGQCFGGVQTLQVIGYEHDGNFLVMKNYDAKQLQEASKMLYTYICYY